MTKKAWLAAIPAAIILFYSSPAGACVGKTLYVGSVGSPYTAVVSEMLSILITERTGTTVVVKYFDGYKALYDAVKKNEVDIMVDYTGRCFIDVMGMPPDPDGGKVFSKVKEVYQREMNLVWLEPFGFSDAAVLAGRGGATPAVCAAVVRKDTLGKFPALPRVINKLAGRLDDRAISRLATEGAGSAARKVTRKFLKDNKLI